VATLAAATLVEHLEGVDLGIDRVLFRQAVTADPSAYGGRMSPLTAVSVLLLSVALWLSGRKSRLASVADLFALAVTAIAAGAFIGYVYGEGALYRLRGSTAMAVHTAVTLLLLSLGLIAAHPERGLARIAASDGPGGRAARRLLPAAAALPFAVGWLRLAGEEAGLYGTTFGVSIGVLALVTIFSGVILWNARSLDVLYAGRRAAEEDTREKGRMLELILDHMSEGVVVADRGGRFLVFNHSAEEILGMPAADAGPERWTAEYGIFRPDGSTPFPSLDLPLARAIRGEHVSGVDLVARNARRPEGVWLRVAARPLQDPEGRLQGGIAIFSDVTERRRLEEAERRAGEMEKASEKARQASRLKSEFLANMSHELRTPLNAIIGFAELLYDGKVGPVAPEQKEFLGDILGSSRHLLQLINDVLDLSKVEAGKMEFHPERVDPATLLTEVRDILRSIAAGKRIAVESQIEPGLGQVVVDPGKLKQVLYNYLSNALKFTPDEGRVTIRILSEDPDHFRLEVEDTGIGIEAPDLKRLFAEFQQLDASAGKRYGGTGLGLALTKRLVEAQGGRVWARSVPGNGSTFYATLPRVAAGGPTAPRRSVPAPPPASPGVPAPSVLVVEDDPGERDWLLAALSRAGCVVETVGTRRDAIARARERRYDAITLDMLLPDGSGRDVLATLGPDGPNAATRVVVLTVVAERGALAGFRVHNVLTKPVSEEQIVASVLGGGPDPEGRPEAARGA
jgi:PAS domain S-box-containing protein